MDWQSVGAYVSANWLSLLIALLLGFVLGWLIIGLPARRRAQAAEAQVADLDSKVRKFESDLNAARRQAEGWQASLGSYESSLSEARSQLSSLRVQVQTLDEEKTALHADLASRSTQADILEKQLAQFQYELAGVSDAAANQSAALETQLELATQTLQGKDVALREAYGYLGSLQRDLDGRGQALLAAEKQSTDLRRELGEIEQHRMDLENRLQSVRNEVAGELALLTSAMIRMKEDQLGAANARIAALTRQLEALANMPGNG